MTRQAPARHENRKWRSNARIDGEAYDITSREQINAMRGNGVGGIDNIFIS
jgi:hypothetical protein